MRSVIILGSSRGDGNTARVVDFLREQTGYDVINLLDYKIGYYDYEYNNHEDDYFPLMNRLLENYDRFIFATPVYWYTMSAVLKTFIDRISDLLRVNKDEGRKLRGKHMAVISCGHANDLVEGFELPFLHSANYLGMHYEGGCYTWNDGGELTTEVQQIITNFAKQLTTNESTRPTVSK